MSPAAQAVAIPTRTEIEAWTTRHLADAASAWRGAAAASEDAFDQHRQNIVSPGGTTWEGDAKDAALDRVTRDTAVVGSQNEVLLGAADTAENGVTDINAAQREVLAAITAAEADGFRVGEDLSVTDTRAYDLDTAAARATAATEHAEDIRWTAERLVQADSLAGSQLQAKAAELEGIRFDGEGDSRDPTIRMVDNETEEPAPAEADDGTGDADEAGTGSEDTGGSDGESNPKDPHPDYPNRSVDGTYGPGNSGDGKAAEKAALDERERKTHIAIVREQVRATHPDVENPKTGKPQHRYYDGLEPTGNPDEYIGIEAKTNEDSGQTHQQEFDDAVTVERPATAVLDGREIKIVDAQTVYPPDGWVPPSQRESSSDSAPSTGGGAQPGASASPVPPSLTSPGAVQGGGVPAPVAGSPVPDWGTQLTPQQMIDSDDPALRVAGQEIRRRMAEQGIVDPSGIA